MSKPVHGKLKRLIADHGERKPPIAFGGRESIIGSICEISQYLFDAERFLGGDTFIVGGPPGSGKTSLVHEVIKRLAGKTAGRRPVQTVFCADPSVDGAYQKLLWDLASALTGTDKQKLAAVQESFFGGEASVEGVGAVKGEYGRQKTTGPAISPATSLRFAKSWRSRTSLPWQGLGWPRPLKQATNTGKPATRSD